MVVRGHARALPSAVMSQKLGPDGHPIPEQQGVVGAVMQPIKLGRPAGESSTKAVGLALDEHGNPIDQTELLKLIEAESQKP